MIFLIFNLVVFLPKSSAAVLELEPHNFEVSVTDFEYAAVLFHDNSADSNNVLNLWREAADMLPRGNAVLATVISCHWCHAQKLYFEV